MKTIHGAVLLLGCILLVAFYMLTVSRATAQDSAQFVGIVPVQGNGFTIGFVAITATGNVYGIRAQLACNPNPNLLPDAGCPAGWGFLGNVVSGTVQIQNTTVSGVKSLYKQSNSREGGSRRSEDPCPDEVATRVDRIKSRRGGTGSQSV